MTDTTRMTKAELIEEVERLRRQHEELAASTGSNGKFDEDELFSLADGAEGDELFLVTETGRFVYANETALDLLGYTEAEFLGMSMPAIDPNNTRAAWLGRVSRLKQSGEQDVFETEHQAKDGTLQAKRITALPVAYRSRNYILCVGNRIEREEEQAAPTPVRSREKILMQTTSDGVLVVDTRGSIVESNSAADRMLNVAKSEIIGRSCVDSRWRLVDNDGAPLSISNHPLMITLVEEQPLFNRRISMLTTDGTRRVMMINSSPVFDESGTLTGAIGCIRPYEDSVERKELQLRDSRLNAMFREVVQVLIGAGTVDDLERRVCEAIVRQGDYPLAWRGIRKDTDERIHPTCSAGDAADYLMKIKVRYDDSEYGNGPLGRAMKTREQVIVQDLATDPTYEPWLRQAERAGLHSLGAFPLMHDGEDAGLLVLYSRDRNHFTGPELERVQQIAAMMAQAIVVRRRLEQARELQGEVEAQRALLRAFEGLLPVAIARFDTREPFRCESANAHFSALVDEPFRSTGVEGAYVSDFMYSVYHRDLYQQLQAASASGEIGVDEEQFTDWQGQPMRWSWRILPVSGATGQEELLYVAFRLDAEGSGAEAEQQTPVESSASPSKPAETSDGDPALLVLAAPKFGPRAKAETRVERFMDEGRVLQANGPALRMFDSALPPDGGEPAAFFGDAAPVLLGEAFTCKNSGETVRCELLGRERDCRVFFTPTDGGSEYLLVIG